VASFTVDPLTARSTSATARSTAARSRVSVPFFGSSSGLRRTRVARGLFEGLFWAFLNPSAGCSWAVVRPGLITVADRRIQGWVRFHESPASANAFWRAGRSEAAPALRPDIAHAVSRVSGLLVGSMKEVNLLAGYLRPEERVLALTGAQGEGFGVLACTSQRLLFLFVGIVRKQADAHTIVDAAEAASAAPRLDVM
jgi:hypothetical protein